MDFCVEDLRLEPIYSDEDSLEHGAALDELDIRVRSRQFRGGGVTAVMSGVTVDLRQAALNPEGATLSVQSALSDIDILVPRDWHVDCEVKAVWGRVGSDRFPPPAHERGPRLRVVGMVVGGSLCVR